MKHLKKKDWINYGRWVQPPLSGTFWVYWNETESVKEITRCILSHNLFIDGHTLGHVKDAEQVYRLIETMVAKNQVDAFVKHFEKTGEKYKQAHVDAMLHPDSNSSRQVTRIIESYQNMVGIWWFAVMFADILQEFVIEKGIASSADELVDIMQQVSVPQTWLERQSSEVAELAKKIQNIKTDHTTTFVLEILDIMHDATEHANRYGWFGTHHWMGDSYSMKKHIHDIREQTRKAPQENKDSATTERKDPIWRLLASMTFWRTHCAEVTAMVIHASRPLLTAFAHQWNLTYDEFLHLSHREIQTAIREGHAEFSLPENFHERRKGYACIYHDGKEHIFTADQLREVLDRIVAQKKEAVEEIKGVVASKGETETGKVTVLISPDDFEKFEPGDILVAPETTPDFVPCMKMASAIITDRGGVTSHAAIVSRELNVPCIIGTKVATQVLSTGDRVEVDTESGMVRIL